MGVAVFVALFHYVFILSSFILLRRTAKDLQAGPSHLPTSEGKEDLLPSRPPVWLPVASQSVSPGGLMAGTHCRLPLSSSHVAPASSVPPTSHSSPLLSPH